MDNGKEMHEGHKRRLRDRFSENSNFKGFNEHEILELLLNFVNIRQNTNDTAHRLIDRFGSLSEVFDATVPELMTVEGVGERMATFISMQRCLFEEYEKNKFAVKNIRDKENLMAYLKTLFITARNKEKLYLMCVSESGRVLKEKFVSEGSDVCVEVEPKIIIKEASLCNCDGVILAHNHPNEISVPSMTDIRMTLKIRELLLVSGIYLIDHYIITSENCISIVEDDRYGKYLQSQQM